MYSNRLHSTSRGLLLVIARGFLVLTRYRSYPILRELEIENAERGGLRPERPRAG